MISANPDLVFDKVDWTAAYVNRFNLGKSYTDYLNNITNGTYRYALLDNVDSGVISPWVQFHGSYLAFSPSEPTRKGIVLLTPLFAGDDAYIQQTVSLPSKPVLIAKVADLAELEPCKTSCSDVIMQVNITEQSTGIESTVYEYVVDSTDGWRTMLVDLPQYANEVVTFKLSAIGGGPCGFCMDWGAVDYLGVGQSS